MPDVKTTGQLWIWDAQKGAWHFLTLEKTLSSKIKAEQNLKRAGFGSIKVRVFLGNLSWTTSIFPDKKRGYVLPVKASIRKKKNLNAGDKITVGIQFI